MQSRNYDVPDQAAFLQKQATQIPGMRRVLAAFLQETQKQEVARGGPAVAAYEFQSGGIIELLNKFLSKFQGELEEVEREESNQAKNHDLMMIQLSNEIDYMKKEIEEKTTLKAKRAKASA